MAKTLTASPVYLAERVGFEPTNTVRCYTLSRRAPSTARPPLHSGRKGTGGSPSYQIGSGRHPAPRTLPRGGRLVRRSRRVTARRHMEAVVLCSGRRRQLDGGDQECVLGIRRIQSF